MLYECEMKVFMVFVLLLLAIWVFVYVHILHNVDKLINSVQIHIHCMVKNADSKCVRVNASGLQQQNLHTEPKILVSQTTGDGVFGYKHADSIDGQRIQKLTNTYTDSCPQPPSLRAKIINTRIENELGVFGLKCPQRYVTFDRYGRLNNWMIIMTNLLWTYVFTPDATQRHSIVIKHDFVREFALDHIFDFDQLARVCVYSYTGQKTDKFEHGSKVFSSVHPHTINTTRYMYIKTFLLFSAIRHEVHTRVSQYITGLTPRLTVLHSRLLENSCVSRHVKMRKDTRYCMLDPPFIVKHLRRLGHADHRFITCSDRQHMDKVNLLLKNLNGSLSPFTSPIEDMILMLNACIFVGNLASTMSVNVHDVREVIIGHASRHVLL
jgi:hypothetical protein